MLEYIKGWLELHGVLDLSADKRAVTALEYGLVAALVAVAIVGALTTLGKNLTFTFQNISSGLRSS